MKQSRILHSILLIMESVLFGMFVIAIACDQFEAIFSDETLVEQAKKQVGEQYTDERDHHLIPISCCRVRTGRGGPAWRCWRRCAGAATR